jgi:hypothetical protein
MPVLGHSTLTTSERHYNQAKGLESARRYHRTLEAIRARVTPPKKSLATRSFRGPRRDMGFRTKTTALLTVEEAVSALAKSVSYKAQATSPRAALYQTAALVRPSPETGIRLGRLWI